VHGKYIITIILAFFFLSGCNSKNILDDSYVIKRKEAQQKKQANYNYTNGRFEYRILPHDRIGIAVYGHSDLSAKGALVDSRGNIMLPLINSVHIGGLTQPQASRKLQARYRRYLKHPSIQLEVLNKRAYVIGEVLAPGPIALPNEEMPLLQAIALARDFKDTANRSKIIVLRSVGRGTRAKVVDLTNLTSLSYAGMMIRPNDIVYVAPSDMKKFELNIGRVYQIASYMLTPFAAYKTLTK
jgi:polysaccharide export outer membrane protein